MYSLVISLCYELKDALEVRKVDDKKFHDMADNFFGYMMKNFETELVVMGARIVPIALEAYYVHGIPIATTIMDHSNIYDFCLRQKSSKDFHYEGWNRARGEKTIYNKLIRYYVSNTGEKLLKVKNPECQSNAADVSQVEAGEWVCTVCNHLPKNTTTAGVNYDYYIEKAERIVHKILYKGKTRRVVVDPNQLSLF